MSYFIYSLDPPTDTPQLFNIADVRNRHCRNLNAENTRPFRNDPDDPSAAALKVILEDLQDSLAIFMTHFRCLFFLLHVGAMARERTTNT